MQLNKENFIKSPFNYTGGKYKLLNQIIPLFPSEIDTFYDLFAGGANVAVNVKAKKIIANDIQHQVIQFLKACKDHNCSYILNKIDNLIDKYNLSKTNREGYFKLRDYYNKENRDSIVFYTLTCYAFNHMIRFNKKCEYTYSFGKDRSSFNPTMRELNKVYL